MRKRLILALLLCSGAFMFSGCTSIMMYTYGLRNPKIENKASITKFAQKIDVATDNLYGFKDSAAQFGFFNSHIGTPEMRFYDKNGNLMKYHDDKKCNGQNDSLISFLDPKNVVSVDSSQNIHNYLHDLRTLDGNELSQDDFKGYDYYAIIYWAKYVGPITNKGKIQEWEKTVRAKTNLKLKVIKVTADYMDYWHPNKKTMIKIYGQKIEEDKHNKQ